MRTVLIEINRLGRWLRFEVGKLLPVEVSLPAIVEDDSDEDMPPPPTSNAKGKRKADDR